MTENTRLKMILLACFFFIVNSFLTVSLGIDVIFWKRLVWDLSHWLAIGLFLWAVYYPLIQLECKKREYEIRQKTREEVYNKEKARIRQLAAYPVKNEWVNLNDPGFIGQPFPTEVYITRQR